MSRSGLFIPNVEGSVLEITDRNDPFIMDAEAAFRADVKAKLKTDPNKIEFRIPIERCHEKWTSNDHRRRATLALIGQTGFPGAGTLSHRRLRMLGALAQVDQLGLFFMAEAMTHSPELARLQFQGNYNFSSRMAGSDMIVSMALVSTGTPVPVL